MKRAVSDVRSEVISLLSEIDRSRDRINGGLSTSFSPQLVSEKIWTSVGAVTAGSVAVEVASGFRDG